MRNVENEMMTRSEIVLAALAAGGAGASFSIFRLQKLLFLIDQEASDLIGGRRFQFSAGEFGPYEVHIHEDLGLLVENAEILVDDPTSVSAVELTTKGLRRGDQILLCLSDEARQAVADLTRWMLSRSVAEILAEIFDRYPEMAENSMLRVRPSGYPRPLDECSKAPFLSGMASAIDFAGTLRRNFSKWIDIEYEGEGIASDWDAVGESFRDAMSLTTSEHTST